MYNSAVLSRCDTATMADSGRPGETAMKSVIAQLGERQQLISKNAVNDRPSTAAVKPLPAGKKPTGTVAPGSPRIPAKQPPSATKPTVSALQSPSPNSNKRLPVQSGMSQPAAASADQTELLCPSRLKPTIAAKPQVSGPSSTSSQSADEVGPVPPWQNLVRKKNVPPVAVKRTAPASSATPTTTSTPADVEFGVGSPAVDDSEQSHNLAKDPRSSASIKVRSLKLAFEGASHDAAADVAQTNRRSSSVSVAGTSKKPVATSTPASSKAVDSKPDVDQEGDRALSARAAAGLGDSSPSSRRPSPRRQPVSVDNSSTASRQEIVFGVDGRRYRRLPPPAEPTGRPARKPAKPPVVDLTPYRSFAAPSSIISAAADDDDDEIYDDAAAPPPTNDGQVTLRCSEPAGGGRQNATSVISQISEYTEEEEEMERRTLKKAAVSNTAAVCPPVSQSSDEVYDDVAAQSADVGYYDDEIYQDID